MLDAGNHPKWHQVDLAAPLPGWQRLAAAEDAASEAMASIIAYGEYLSYECVACHRAETQDSAIPVIAALPSTYFMDALAAYRSGLRHHLVMQDIARSLDEEQIKALASYYATQRETGP